MARKANLIFNEAAKGPTALPKHGLSFVIRTDANHATASFKQSLRAHLLNGASPEIVAAMTPQINTTVHDAYQNWGHTVLNAAARDLDYAQYGLYNKIDQKLQVHFYNAASLSSHAIVAGADYAAQYDSGNDEKPDPVLFITLDDMINKPDWVADQNWAEFSISRLFATDGSGGHLGYTARPGTVPLSQQLAAIRGRVSSMHSQSGITPKIVLLEDNVRNIEMINRIITMLDDGDVFKNAELSCIATCFCCAPMDKRDAIHHNGKAVPLAIVIDYADAKVDVVTPRDLLFDGLAVSINTGSSPSSSGRMPAQYLDLNRAFKIRAGHEEKFMRSVNKASRNFCRAIENEYNVKVPLAWFSGAAAIQAKTGTKPDTRMIDFLR